MTRHVERPRKPGADDERQRFAALMDPAVPKKHCGRDVKHLPHEFLSMPMYHDAEGWFCPGHGISWKKPLDTGAGNALNEVYAVEEGE